MYNCRTLDRKSDGETGLLFHSVATVTMLPWCLSFAAWAACSRARSQPHRLMQWGPCTQRGCGVDGEMLSVKTGHSSGHLGSPLNSCEQQSLSKTANPGLAGHSGTGPERKGSVPSQSPGQEVWSSWVCQWDRGELTAPSEGPTPGLNGPNSPGAPAIKQVLHRGKSGAPGDARCHFV